MLVRNALARVAYFAVPRSYRLTSLFGWNGLRSVLYHHVAAAADVFTDQVGVTIHPEDFEWQLDVYVRDYDVIDLDTVLSGRLPRRPLLITFDDAYRSVLDTAAPMLKARGLPSVFFLASSVIAGDELMLDNLLCYLANRFGLGELERFITGEEPRCGSLARLINGVVADLPYAARRSLPERLAARFEVDSAALRRESNLYLTPEDVARLPEFGMEIGNHTGSHVHCRSLDADEAVGEISDAKRQLEEWSGRPVRAFSYPYGQSRDMTEVAMNSVRECGHEAEFLVHARAMGRGHEGPVWFRTSVTARDEKQLFVDLEVLPRLRAMRGRRS